MTRDELVRLHDDFLRGGVLFLIHGTADEVFRLAFTAFDLRDATEQRARALVSAGLRVNALETALSDSRRECESLRAKAACYEPLTAKVEELRALLSAMVAT